eukprot:504536_1
MLRPSWLPLNRINQVTQVHYPDMKRDDGRINDGIPSYNECHDNVTYGTKSTTPHTFNDTSNVSNIQLPFAEFNDFGNININFNTVYTNNSSSNNYGNQHTSKCNCSCCTGSLNHNHPQMQYTSTNEYTPNNKSTNNPNILNSDENDNIPLQTKSVAEFLVDTIQKGVENEQIASIVAQTTNSLITNTKNIQQTLENLMKANIINILNKAIKIHSKSAKIQKECKLALNNVNKIRNKYTKTKITDPSGFQCKECGKVYKHLCNLRSHSKIHTDSAYVCKFCGKRFGRRGNYNEHRRVHTGEAPFQCDICKKSFKQKHGWKNHVISCEKKRKGKKKITEEHT